MNTGRSLGDLGALGRIGVCVIVLARVMLWGCLRLIAQYFLSKTSCFFMRNVPWFPNGGLPGASLYLVAGLVCLVYRRCTSYEVDSVLEFLN